MNEDVNERVVVVDSFLGKLDRQIVVLVADICPDYVVLIQGIGQKLDVMTCISQAYRLRT